MGKKNEKLHRLEWKFNSWKSGQQGSIIICANTHHRSAHTCTSKFLTTVSQLNHCSKVSPEPTLPELPPQPCLAGNEFMPQTLLEQRHNPGTQRTVRLPVKEVSKSPRAQLQLTAIPPWLGAFLPLPDSPFQALPHTAGSPLITAAPPAWEPPPGQPTCSQSAKLLPSWIYK